MNGGEQVGAWLISKMPREFSMPWVSVIPMQNVLDFLANAKLSLDANLVFEFG
jgi:hypothetical protein